MVYDHAQKIEDAELELKRLHQLMSDTYANTDLVRPQAKTLAHDDPRCPKQCGRFMNEHGIEGNRSCRHHCGRDHHQSVARNNELRGQEIKRHITPITNQIEAQKQIIKNEKEKATLPILRNSLITNLEAFRTLSLNDPQYRQKQIDMEKELFEQSQEIDTLETKYNLFGNIPTMKREIIRPDAIIQTTTELGAINKRPLIIGGIVGLAALFLIWRFK